MGLKVLRRESSPKLQLAVAATTVTRRMSVVCRNDSLFITTRPATPRAHDYTVKRGANSPLDQDVAMRFGVSTQHTNQPRKDAYMPTPKHANAHAQRSI
eukprot:6179863-Pleurochrysis_carterae.AAC.1